MKHLLKSKTLIVLIFALFISGAIFFSLNQFIVMPWEKSEMPKIENPRLVVKKSERKLFVFDGEKLVKTYEIVLGFTPVGDKEISGDGKTPEGEFYVFTKNDQSKYFLSLGVSYPMIEDATRGWRENLISKEEHDAILQAVKDKKMPPQNTKLGGAVYIHGGGIAKDWTWGCMALRDEEMKEVFDAAEVGTSIKILP